MKSRAERIIERASLGENEAIYLTKPSNMFYVSGYTGEGAVVFGHGFCAIVTDSRYTEQAGRQAPGFDVLEIRTGQRPLERNSRANAVEMELTFSRSVPAFQYLLSIPFLRRRKSAPSRYQSLWPMNRFEVSRPTRSTP